MLRPSRNRPRPFQSHLLLDILRRAPSMHALRLWGQRNLTVHMRTRINQLTLTPVPLCQNLRRRCTPQDPRVNQPCKAHAGDVS